MKILVLGATGPTGRLIVGEAIGLGHEVVALVRDDSKASDLHGVNLVQGDARDRAALASALDGCDGVISALGTKMSPFSRVDLLSSATKALVQAMIDREVRRLICITGLGAGDSRGHGGFLFDRVILPLLLSHVYDDKDRQEAVVRGSDLDWTLVRPMVLTNKPPSGHVQAQVDLTNVHGGSISRADVAHFVVEELTTRRWLKQAPLIKN
jgi:putative NADH-flavin reductase